MMQATRSSPRMPFDSPLFVHAMRILLDDDDIDDCNTAVSNVSHLLECFADALTPMEDACVNDLQAAAHEMNQMHTFAPQLGRFPELLLEHTSVRSALMESFTAMQQSKSVRIVRLDGFPSRELELGLQNLPKNLHRLDIIHTSRSQSICADALYDLPATLQTIHIDARIVLQNDKDCERLAQSLGRLDHLTQLELHFLPRIRQDRVFRLDRLFDHLPTSLQVLTWTAGYEHNYHTTPLLSIETFASFLQRSESSLVELQLDNFGLRDAHLHCIPSNLRKLRLAKHHAQAFTPNLHILQDTNLEECIFWTDMEAYGRKEYYPEFYHYQEQLHLQCLIRKWCHDTFGTAVHTAAASEHRLALSALYAIVRFNPTMLAGE